MGNSVCCIFDNLCFCLHHREKNYCRYELALQSESSNLLSTHGVKDPLVTVQVGIPLAILATSGISSSQTLRGKKTLVRQFNSVSEFKEEFPQGKSRTEMLGWRRLGSQV